MRYRASFLSGLAAGYVLGARAGRERYEQIRRVAATVRSNPQVQRAADTVGTQAGHVVGNAARVAVDKGKAVSGKVGDKLPNRLTDKLPSTFGRQREDDWQPYAHSGQNGHPGGTTGGPTPPGGPSHI
jgi:hypothetical protein